ncbi:E3 ubiquitin-protein ligase TRIM65-like [Ambystoma mexicanum]|uniref:E3 ubiquitin-protein ligase TRIM65-like n=1 Tax=Ambystoma mexicanum TaxID=8296 RepID=UPI0037E9248D
MTADLKHKLQCPICLEIYKKPVTLTPICGHSFCRECIEKHWDKEHQVQVVANGDPTLEGGQGYSCPECRQSVPQRPQLSISVALSSITEDVMTGLHWKIPEPQEEQSLEPQPPLYLQPELQQGIQAFCSRHNRSLELYCIPDQRCICCECTVRECKEHPRTLLSEQRRDKEKTLHKTLLETKQHLNSTEAEMSKTEEKAKNIQENSTKFIDGISKRFAELRRTLEECQVLSEETIQGVTQKALEQAQSNLVQLQSRRDALLQHQQQAEQLLRNPNDVAFLQNLTLLSSPGASAVLPAVDFPISQKVAPIVEVLSQTSKLLQDGLANSLLPTPSATVIKESPIMKAPSIVKPGPSCLPEGGLRTILLKDYRNLTFDPNTANRYLRLSGQDRRAKHTESPDSQRLEHPDRFESWQVLCCQSFQEGSHYWEVKLSDHFVYLGVAYGAIDRKRKDRKTSIIGRNAESWSLQVQRNCHIVWHSGQDQKLMAPLYSRIGVHLDCSAGTLSFYGIEKKMELLHTFTWIISAPVYPAFWIGEGVEVSLVHQKPKDSPEKEEAIPLPSPEEHGSDLNK